MKFLEEFTLNLADEAARYFDLHAVHGSPTSGNRTTQGSTIDVGTFRYLDAYHQDYSYLYDQFKVGGKYGQTAQLKDYLDPLVEYLSKNGYLTLPSNEVTRQLRDQFDIIYAERLTQIWFARLGLPEKAIAKISTKNKKLFFNAVKAIYEAKGEKKVAANGKQSRPAAYEPKKILSNTLSALVKSGDTDLIDYDELFKNKKFWASTPVKGNSRYIAAYQKALSRIFSDLGSERNEWIDWAAKAKTIAAKNRPSPDAELFSLDERNRLVSETLTSIKNHGNFMENSKLARKAAEEITDIGLPERKTRTLPNLPCVQSLRKIR